MDVLPDSRSIERRGGIRAPNGETLIPVYCANCGTPWGRVREKDMTFAFVLCQPCADKHGDIAHTYQEPDAAFWARIREAEQAQVKRLGRIPEDGLEPHELAIALSDPSSELSKLAEEWRRHVASKE